MRQSDNLISRLLLTAAFFLLICMPLTAETTFTGYAGIKGDFDSDPAEDDFTPRLMLDTFFSGQLALSENFFIRGEFSIQTEDLFATSMFDKKESEFYIDELSATYIKPFLGNTQYISLFCGTFEPIGSDVFLQRQFGIKPISSLITENWLGLRGPSVYPFYGAGGSYVLHFDSVPVASGLYIYMNKENEKRDKQLNLDWRFATVLNLLTLDFSVGIGAPMSDKSNGKDVILVIDTLYLHTGVDMLLGDRYSFSVYGQAGFKDYAVRAGDEENDFGADDIYLILEPRICTDQFHANFSVFSLPAESVETMMFISALDDAGNPLKATGLNISVFTDKLYIKNTNYSFGYHLTYVIKDKTLWDCQNPKSFFVDSDYSIKISPFVSMPLLSGDIKLMLQADLTEFKDNNWKKALKLNVGYKSIL